VNQNRFLREYAESRKEAKEEKATEKHSPAQPKPIASGDVGPQKVTKGTKQKSNSLLVFFVPFCGFPWNDLRLALTSGHP
jgi:hypothetical protein